MFCGPQDISVRLAIKKVYFNEIKDGLKTIEYRSYTPFYKRMLLDKNPTVLKLHYYTAAQLVLKIKAIKLIKTPTAIAHLPFISKPQCIAIYLDEMA